MPERKRVAVVGAGITGLATARFVAQAGLAALFAGEAEVIPGALNKISSKLTGLVPKFLTEKIAAGIYEKHLK